MPDEQRPQAEGLFWAKFGAFFYNVIDKPVTAIRETIVKPIQDKNKTYYYHRRFRRVPTIDECYTDDMVCIFEANEQFKRDKLVDDTILHILRQRFLECETWHGPDAPKYCSSVYEDYVENSGNWFEKYGELGPTGGVRAAYMKQKHKTVWERRHGKVGSGVKTDSE